MLTIRLARVGKNKRAQFKIVLQEHTIAPGGRHIEVLGSYDPHLKKTVFKEEKIKSWISKGAKISDTVYNLLVSNGIISGEKRKVKLPAKKVDASQKKEKAKEEAKAESPKEEAKNAEKAEIKTEEKKEKEK